MKVFGIIGIVILSIAIMIGLWIFGHSMYHADKIAQNAIVNYEEFQEIYNTCRKINSDLGNIKGVPSTDKMFDMTSKEAMLVSKRQQMNRWVEEYNAKSKMWNRNVWKSDKLPYQLSANEFSNY